jgi:prophage antirepressor-like protein
MEESLKIFENTDFGEIRTLELNGKVLLCGNDVAKSLGYKRPSEAITQLCKYTVKHRIVTKKGNMSDMNFIPEGDVYRLIIRSKLPSAERFERWVFDTVIPQINHTGSYIPQAKPEDETLILSKANYIMQNKLALADSQIKSLQPKAEFYDKFISSDTCLDMNTVAKSLDIGIGRNKIMQALRDKKILYKEGKNTMPYQKYCNQGLFKVSYGIGRNGQIYGVTKVLPKGIDYLAKIFNTVNTNLEVAK